MTPRDQLLAVNQPLWAEEARVCRDYFRSPARTVGSDLRWLARQAAKELVDGVLVRATAVASASEVLDVVALAEELHEEALHLAAFVAAYDALRDNDVPSLDRASLEQWAAWPANLELRELRARHRQQHGRVGELAALITEGGKAALFVEGRALAGRGGADDVIAVACAAAHADEVDHMEAALDRAAANHLGADGWSLLIELTESQSRRRIAMRHEQFHG
jgi:hypothetical protein